MINDSTEYIARISYGKDSLKWKMLDDPPKFIAMTGEQLCFF